MKNNLHGHKRAFHTEKQSECLEIKKIMHPLMNKSRLMKRNFQLCEVFTLIELLMVIAIITILAALLFPAMGKAREQAKSIACANHQRQLLLTANSYADENRCLPLAYDSAKTLYWGYVMRDYFPKYSTGKPTVFICPSAAPYVWNGLNDWSQVYGMAWFFQDRYDLPIVFHLIKNPSDWPLFADSVHPSSLTSSPIRQRYIIFADYNGYVHLRHNRKANLAYVDGSVRSESGSNLMRFRNTKYYSDRNFFSFFY